MPVSPKVVKDHGQLDGLLDDDHAQYLNEVRHDALAANPHGVTFTQAVSADPGTNISAAEAETLTNGSNADALHAHTMITDHGDLAGLDDVTDHTWALLVNGTRELSGNWDAGPWEIWAEKFRSDVLTGTAPFTVASTTKVINLNADLLDGLHVGASGNAIPALSGNNIWTGTQDFDEDVALFDDRVLSFGDGFDIGMQWQTPAAINWFEINIGVGSISKGGYITLCETGDAGAVNRRPPIANDPHFRIYSADGTQIDDWIEWFHDQVNARIDWGNGDLRLHDQIAISSVGAVSAVTQLTVDNLRLDGNALTSIAGTITVTPFDNTFTLASDTNTIGAGGGDVSITFAGTTNNGVMHWIGAADLFSIDDDVFIGSGSSSRGLSIRDIETKLRSINTGELDIESGTSVNIDSGSLRLKSTSAAVEMRLYEMNGPNYVGFKAPALAGDQMWTLPAADGNANEFLVTDGGGALSWASTTGAIGSGTDDRIVRWHGTNQLQDSGIGISDADAISGVTHLTVDNIILDANDITSATGNDLDIFAAAGQMTNIGTDGNVTLFAGTLRVFGPAQNAKGDLGTSLLQWNDAFFDGTVRTDALRIDEGSVTTSTGTGTVKMGSANPANSDLWIPINVDGDIYYVPAWSNPSP